MDSKSTYPIIKVCGLRQQENVSQLATLPINWMGFIDFASSPRSISNTDLKWIAPFHAQPKVLVVVNKPVDELLQVAKQGNFQMVQLHGDESPEYCATVRQSLPVIKAISLKSVEDLDSTSMYSDSVDYFLFDTKKAGQRGGSGQKFDWSILEQYNLSIPFLLSGGIGPDDAQALKNFSHPQFAGIDINSKFEVEPGLKDVQLVRSFIEEFLS